MGTDALCNKNTKITIVLPGKQQRGEKKLQALEINPGRIMERQYLIVHQPCFQGVLPLELN